MPRARRLWPEFFNEVALLAQPDAALLFLYVWCYADDNGVIPNESDRFRHTIFGMRSAVPTVAVVQELVTWLIDAGYLVAFTADRTEYVAVKPSSWERYQMPIERATIRYPAPEEVTAERHLSGRYWTCKARRPESPTEPVVKLKPKPPRKKKPPPNTWEDTEAAWTLAAHIRRLCTHRGMRPRSSRYSPTEDLRRIRDRAAEGATLPEIRLVLKWSMLGDKARDANYYSEGVLGDHTGALRPTRWQRNLGLAIAWEDRRRGPNGIGAGSADPADVVDKFRKVFDFEEELPPIVNGTEREDHGSDPTM